MTDKQINKFSDLTFTQFLGYDLVATFNNNNKIKELQEQLKRKEQECEQLKDKLNCCFCNPYVELNDIEKQRKCIEVTECFRRQLDQLKAENDELKKKCNIYTCGICGNKEDCNKLYKTLTEIKEIAEKPYSLPCGGVCIYPDCEDDLTDNGKYCMELKFKRILQKISECEVENDK